MGLLNRCCERLRLSIEGDYVMIEETQNPMSPEEVAAKLIEARFRTGKQIEKDAMSKKMNQRDKIAEKEAEIAANREYGIEGSMRNGL